MNTIQRAQQAKSAMAAPRRIAVVPVFNEENTVLLVLDELERLVDQIVVVDDGSTDRSRQLITAWARHRRAAHTIFFERNRGLSAAYYAAFKDIAGLVAASELSADDLIITVDADGQHDPADLERLTRRVTEEGFDAAVARRDLSGYSVLKRTGNNLLTWWASLWAGIRFYDVESGYRVFRAGPLIDALK
jgi:glycosyltransferase involved in cell wall biosynthesis